MENAFQRYLHTFYLFLFTSICFFLPGENADPRFIILHLDGISTELFMREYHNGHLPNLRRVFREEGIIPHAITLFPGETEMIVPRMRTGENSQTGDFVAWGYYDRQTREKTTKPDVFFYLVDQLPRRARSGFYYGLPGYHLAAGPAMVNMADLINQYKTLHFYWFSTDTFGHFLGESGALQQLYRFDRYFGKLERRLDEDVNIIIYADHGMTFSSLELIDLKEEIDSVLEGEVEALFKPNLYLKNPDKKDEAAKIIAGDTKIDFAFFRKDSNTVIGYYQENKLTLSQKNGAIRYTYQGKDPFAYQKVGYDGEYLTPDEWLSLTHDAQYPASPPLLFWYAQNPRTGDVIVILDYPRIPGDLFYILNAHHSGLIDTDLSVPVLLRGEHVQHLYNRDYLWLHHLYKEIPDLDVDGVTPRREKHSFSIWAGTSSRSSYRGFEGSYSPAYRWRISGKKNRRGARLWGERDLFSSYLTRLWAGLGGQYVDSDPEPMFTLQYEIRYLQLSSSLQYFRSYYHQDSYMSLSWNFHPSIAATWIVPRGLGMTISW